MKNTNQLNKMTENKLPEVGQEYRSKAHKKIMKVKGFTDEVHFSGNMSINCIDRKDFWDHFEELPDQPTSAKSAQVGSEKLEEAKELVKLTLTDYPLEYLDEILSDLRQPAHYLLIRRAQKLIDALEEQKADNTSKESENMHTKKEHVQETDVKAEPEDNLIDPHKVSSLICTCGYKQVSVYPAFTLIEKLQCGKCLRVGQMQIDDENAKVDEAFWDKKKKPNCNTLGKGHLQERLNGGKISDCLDCGAKAKPEEEPAISKMETTESIWKPISELLMFPQEDENLIIVKFKNETISILQYKILIINLMLK